MASDAAESTPHTNRAFYDRISGVYDTLSDSNERAARETGQTALDLQAGEQVLEIGFGTGNAVLDLARAVGPEGKVSGIDVSDGMLSVASEKVAREGLSQNVDLQVADARKLPFDDAVFDAAFTSFTLELFELDEIPEVLTEVARVLKPGGRLGVVSMAAVAEGEHESVLEKTYKWMHRHFPHIVDCQPIDVSSFVSGAGFELTREIPLEIWTMPVRAVVGTKASG